jgi:hypothetical protein
MKISLVINCDTRPENLNENGMSKGVVSRDFLTDGVFGKIQFFKGFELETILFIDKHEDIPQQTLDYVHAICDTVVVRKHTNEHSFNDWNYHKALSLASGDIVCHADQDTAMFTSGKAYVQELINNLDIYKFVSYPSHWTPRAVYDETFGHRTWASTRFFLCKRETLKLDELANCIREPNWGYNKYGDSPRRCNWTEHFLTLINGDSCFYPPIETDKGVIFSWGNYETYTLRRLNELPYSEIEKWLYEHPINYPVDICV